MMMRLAIEQASWPCSQYSVFPQPQDARIQDLEFQLLGIHRTRSQYTVITYFCSHPLTVFLAILNKSSLLDATLFHLIAQLLQP